MAGNLLLGIPSTRLSPSQRCATSSFVGGEPVLWQDLESWPRCRACQAPMLFVVQVYAPVERHRTLYVWSCAAPTCSRQPCCWHVMRQQAPFEPQDEAAAAPAPRAPSASDGAGGGVDVADTASMWLGAAGKSRADAGGDESSFLGAAGLGEDFERLLSLQESQASDKAATSGTGAANPPQKPAVRGISLPRPNAVPALSCRAIRTEDWGGEDGGGEWHIPASEAGHIQELERTYVELNGEIPTAGPGAGAGAAGGEVEEYEATPPAVKAMLRFQHAVQAQPRQVMRYHYGAEPLWSCPPPRRVCGGAPGDPHVASGARLDSSGVAVAPPSDSARSSEHQGADGEPDPGTASGRAGCVEHASRAQEAPPAVAVPACACGKGRVFEAQLMPALASLVAESIGDAPSAAVAEAVGGSGAAQQAPNPGAPAPALPPAAEWTTALIYSCPDACASSSVEHALVVVE